MRDYTNLGSPYSPDIIERIVEEQKQRVKELEARSKSLHELVVSEVFTVDKVVSESYATSFTPQSEIVFGGKCPVYKGGFTARLVLGVTPDNKSVPVRALSFCGISAVRAGDRVSARIPRYLEETVTDIYSRQYNNSRVFYLDRGFNAKESSIELAILSDDGKILREDRAVNYRDFVKY